MAINTRMHQPGFVQYLQDNHTEKLCCLINYYGIVKHFTNLRVCKECLNIMSQQYDIKAKDIDYSKLNHKELIKFHTKVRRSFIESNKQKYLKQCFKIGDVVYFKEKQKANHYSMGKTPPLNGNTPSLIGEVDHIPHIQRNGRIQTYRLVYYVNGGEEQHTARGIRQVRAATPGEAKGYKLVKAVRKI